MRPLKLKAPKFFWRDIKTGELTKFSDKKRIYPKFKS